MGLLENIRAKYELYRLEQRYTRRDKRTTFVSGAQYVNGEYIYSNGSGPLSGPGTDTIDTSPSQSSFSSTNQPSPSSSSSAQQQQQQSSSPATTPQFVASEFRSQYTFSSPSGTISGATTPSASSSPTQSERGDRGFESVASSPGPQERENIGWADLPERPSMRRGLRSYSSRRL